MRLEELAGAMGINVDHVKPSTSEDLKSKIAQIAKDPALAKYLPTRFQGPNGTWVDRFGNNIEPTKSGTITVSNLSNENEKWAKWHAEKKKQAAPAKYYQPYSPIGDQKLIQMIGVASNMNVTISTSYGKHGKHHRLTCEKCRLQIHINDEMFVESRYDLKEPIEVFCKAHRHEDKPAEVPVVTGRRFREDD